MSNGGSILQELQTALVSGVDGLEPAQQNHLATFIQSRLNPAGGFNGRNSRSDLYFTLFGLQLLTALRLPLPATLPAFLDAYGTREKLDLVHLASLIRCRTLVGLPATGPVAAALTARLAEFRARDGGFAPIVGGGAGTAYGSFLALGAYQDAACSLPDPAGLLSGLQKLARSNGSYSNSTLVPIGNIPVTAAAITLLRHLGQPVPEKSCGWLAGTCLPAGGFPIVPLLPRPDLLATGVALFALHTAVVDLGGCRASCRDYVGSLWATTGGFKETVGAKEPDLEYTVYGLLALGSLEE